MLHRQTMLPQSRSMRRFTVTNAPVIVQLTPSTWYLTGGNLTLTAAIQSWSAGPPNQIGTVVFYDGNRAYRHGAGKCVRNCCHDGGRILAFERESYHPRKLQRRHELLGRQRVCHNHRCVK